MQHKTIDIPGWLTTIQYNGKVTPHTAPFDIATTGSNCQVFSYHLLRHYNLVVPNFWSSELWSDTEFSEVITEDYQPLDILFFHRKEDAYGAHVGVYIGNNQVIHLSKQEGLPVIWEIEHFFTYPKYQFLLGGKRFFPKK